MAKAGLPSVEASVTTTAAATVPPVFVGEFTQPKPTEGYVSRRVDVKMTRTQAGILRDKLRTLQDSGAKTADGRFVDNKADAVRWILENLRAK
jgi:hypothetical protein